MTEEIHDMSRVDSFMASRRRAMFFHSVWKPMLAGAVGAAIMSATVIGSVWVILPKISTRDVVVDHVIQHDVPFDNHTPQDKPFDNYVPHAKPFDVPVPAPEAGGGAAPPTWDRDSPYAPKTPDEKKFTAQAGVQDRDLSRAHRQKPGRPRAVVRGRDETSTPPIGTTATGKVVTTRKQRSPATRSSAISACACRTRTTGICGTAPPCTMANGHHHVSGSRAERGTDAATGRLRQSAADGRRREHGQRQCRCRRLSGQGDGRHRLLVPDVDPAGARRRADPRGLAINAGTTHSMLADGKVSDVDVVLIKSITVDGRTLDNVEASVSPSNNAPILLGLGALNRLGPYTVTDGRLVFTGEQPA